MEPKTHVISVAEWLALPEIQVPRIKNDSEEGALLKINKVGFCIVSPRDCQDAGVPAAVVTGGKCFLPTAVVDQDGDLALHRLPMGLLSWVIQCVSFARAGNNPFPTEVEFGELHGQSYAEFLFQRSTTH